jgi:predicted secreted Zn-dependent protease
LGIGSIAANREVPSEKKPRNATHALGRSDTMTREVTMTSTPSIVFAALTAVAAAVGPIGQAGATGSQTQVTYQLSGSAPVADYVSYQSGSGQAGQERLAHVPLPWKTQFTSGGNPVLVISAQGPGSITCTISVDGNVVSQATANGAPARTVCSH